MEIITAADNSKFECTDSVIRDVPIYDEMHDEQSSSPHFQAVIRDRRRNKHTPVFCKLRYEDQDGRFLGLDKDLNYEMDESGEIAVSIPINVPDNATKVYVTIVEQTSIPISERYELVIGICIISVFSVLLVFAAKGFFNWGT